MAPPGLLATLGLSPEQPVGREQLLALMRGVSPVTAGRSVRWAATGRGWRGSM